MRNMYDHMMTLLDTRASRMTPNQALLSLHADYIGGDSANYRKWYFAAHLDLDDAVGFANMKLGRANRRTRKAWRAAQKKAKESLQNEEAALEALEGDNSLEAAEYRRKTRMDEMSQRDRARQIARDLLVGTRSTRSGLCLKHSASFSGVLMITTTHPLARIVLSPSRNSPASTMSSRRSTPTAEIKATMLWTASMFDESVT
ncbi:1,3-beta-D-glucan synthase [Exophiala xenobiotica]|uniref:1,3-beta-D-glucan synthase n=1 Tax=Lithohypha guttulata TaxID=1690604 RepID=A0ABR0JX14_9EURO|nr:1,3-beta-D-glucan synthase [Lithohypha guttulata]KAK5310397.1 1,3-beta-D-glucan synthase [Exophiala xenobiotica]